MRPKSRFDVNVSVKVVSFVLSCVFMGCTSAGELTEKVLIYRGMSDASAGVAVGANQFIVADDENNILRVYRTNQGGPPVFSYDLTGFLEVEPQFPEADIEGATRIGDRVYWISSHGRNKDGKMRPNRYRFFATTISEENDVVSIRPVGRPCKTLVHRLIRTNTMRNLGLDKATRFGEENLKKKDLQNLAPKDQGLNIEGLCASADGSTIYIGFRNPRPPAGPRRTPHALVVPLKNPAAVVDFGEAPVFGEPILWDLGGFGIRSMEYSGFHRAYFVIAGPHDESRQFALYRWSGKMDEPAIFVRQIRSDNSDFTPEGLVPFKNSAKLLLLSDDGTIPVRVYDKSQCAEGELTSDGFCPNKSLTDPNKKTFRAIWIEP